MATVEIISQQMIKDKIQVGAKFNGVHDELFVFTKDEFSEKNVLDKITTRCKEYQEAEDKASQINLIGKIIEVE